MADRNAAGQSEDRAETHAAAAPARGGKSRTVLTVGVLLALEAAVLVGAMFILARPATVEASQDLEAVVSEDEKIVEVMVLDDRLLNSRSGINYLYETEIWVHVRKKHEPAVADELDRFRNEIKAEMMALWRTSDPRQLEEPRMENMTRKVQALLQQRFGNDEASEEPIVLKTLIVAGPGFRVDG